MKATLIIYAKTGEVCNVIRGKMKPSEGSAQRKEFVHMAVDLSVDDLAKLEGEEKESIDLEKQLDPITLAYTKEDLAEIPTVGDFKNPVKSISLKSVVVKDLEVVK